MHTGTSLHPDGEQFEGKVGSGVSTYGVHTWAKLVVGQSDIVIHLQPSDFAACAEAFRNIADQLRAMVIDNEGGAR
jgi:hypothetical protein